VAIVGKILVKTDIGKGGTESPPSGKLETTGLSKEKKKETVPVDRPQKEKKRPAGPPPSQKGKIPFTDIDLEKIHWRDKGRRKRKE